MWGAGCRVQSAGYRVQGTECGPQSVGYRVQQTYHGDEDGEGSKDLGPEPVGGLDVFTPLKNRVVHEELLTGIIILAVANVALDPLLKLRPGSLLQHTRHTNVNHNSTCTSTQIHTV